MSIEMASQHSMEWSSDVADLRAALFAFQQDVTTLPRTKTAEVTTKGGQTFTYKYADLDDTWGAIRPLLNKHGLLVIQGTEVSAVNPGSTMMLVTEVIHVNSGQYLRSFWPFPISVDNPQRTGAWTSYARRYHVQTVLGLSSEDPDANLEGKAAAALADTRNAYVPRIDKLLTQFADAKGGDEREAVEDRIRLCVDELAPWQYDVVWSDLNSHQKAVLRDMLARSRARLDGREIPKGEKDERREAKGEEIVQEAGKRGRSK